MPKLPKEIYVHWENPGNNEEPFLNSHQTPESAIDSASEGESVGVYVLRLVKKAHIERTLR